MRQGTSRIDLGHYGGTVNKENIEQFARLDVLDGVGATRASLDAPGFLTMIDRVAGSG